MKDTPIVFIIVIGSLLIALSFVVYYRNGGIPLPNISIEIPKQEVATGTPTASTPTKTETQKPIYPSKNKEKQYTPGTITPQVPTTYTIIYTDAGFVPQTLQIKAGQSIRFRNESSSSMWVSSVYQGNVPIYSALNQGRSVGKGGTYDFTFTDRLTVLFFNLNYKTHTGVISVE
ncbi:MAG: hypothetical protein AAB545_00995 [Patescibacteria group bacterium]